MGWGRLAIHTLSLWPRFTRPLLAWYIRSGFPLPANAAWAVWQLKRRLTPRGQVLRKIRIGQGLTMEVDICTTVGREIYYHGSFEPAVAQFLNATLAPGQVVLDCGANVGELSLRAAQTVGAQGKVYAIEPSPQTAALLRRNVALNHATNVEVLEVALSDRDTDQTFFLGTDIHSLSSSLWQPADFRGEQLEVRGRTLHTLLQEHGITRLDVMKLDIEGAEFTALRGAVEGWQHLPHLPVLIFEYNKHVAQRAGWTLHDMWSLLTPWGYTLFYLGDGVLGRPYQAEDEAGFAATTKLDVVCCPPAASSSQLRDAVRRTPA